MPDIGQELVDAKAEPRLPRLAQFWWEGGASEGQPLARPQSLVGGGCLSYGGDLGWLDDEEAVE